MNPSVKLEIRDGRILLRTVAPDAALPGTVALTRYEAAELISQLQLALAVPDEAAADPEHLSDGEALDLINYILSAPEYSVSFLEDIAEIVRNRTGRVEVRGATWTAH